VTAIGQVDACTGDGTVNPWRSNRCINCFGNGALDSSKQGGGVFAS